MAHTYKIEDRYRTEGDRYRQNRISRRRAIEQARLRDMLESVGDR